MMKKIKQLVVLVTFLMITSAANAQCDYRPSQWLEGDEIVELTAAVSSVAVLAFAVKEAAGLYIFPHTSGSIMLASKAAGASAAKTVGIMAGTAWFGTAGAFLMITSAAVGGSLVVFEAACYFIDE